MLSTDPSFTGVDRTADGRPSRAGTTGRRRLHGGGDARRGGGGKGGGGDRSGGGTELGFTRLFKHLRINLNRWIGDEQTEKAGL